MSFLTEDFQKETLSPLDQAKLRAAGNPYFFQPMEAEEESQAKLHINESPYKKFHFEVAIDHLFGGEF